MRLSALVLFIMIERLSVVPAKKKGCVENKLDFRERFSLIHSFFLIDSVNNSVPRMVMRSYFLFLKDKSKIYDWQSNEP